jgi:molecular chaperone DnaK
MELVYDPMGAARLRPVTPEEEDSRSLSWVSEQSPTFLNANPPGRKGQPRFEVEFCIDGNKRLLITARDVQTKRIVHRNHPVIKLT